jgi:hypothetical protein
VELQISTLRCKFVASHLLLVRPCGQDFPGQVLRGFTALPRPGRRLVGVRLSSRRHGIVQVTRPLLACAHSGAPFGPSLQPVSRPSSLLRPLLTSVRRSACLMANPAPACARAPHRSPQISPIPFATRSPSLRCRALIGMDFAVVCPLVRSSRLIKRFLLIDPWLCCALPSDVASRPRPCASLPFAPIRLGERLSLFEV